MKRRQKKQQPETVQIDVDIITLAFIYLNKLRRITHREYTYSDLFQKCHDIMKWAEHKNPHRKYTALSYKNGIIEVDKKIIENFFSTALRGKI